MCHAGGQVQRELQEQLDAKAGEVATLTASVAELTSQLEAKQQQLVVLEQQLAQLQQQQDAAARATADAAASVAGEASAQVAQLQQQLAAAESAADVSSAQAQQAAKKASAWQGANQLAAELEAAGAAAARVPELEAALAAAQQQLQQHEAELSRSVSQASDGGGAAAPSTSTAAAAAEGAAAGGAPGEEAEALRAERDQLSRELADTRRKFVAIAKKKQAEYQGSMRDLEEKVGGRGVGAGGGTGCWPDWSGLGLQLGSSVASADMHSAPGGPVQRAPACALWCMAAVHVMQQASMPCRHAPGPTQDLSPGMLPPPPRRCLCSRRLPIRP
jgi:hypothetical protein